MAQAALRQRIDDLGMFPFLDLVITINPSPGQSALSLGLFLDPLYDNLYLMEQLTENPDLFPTPDDGTGTVGFLEKCLRTLELANAALQGGGGPRAQQDS